MRYLTSLTEEKRAGLLYESIMKEKDDALVQKLQEIIDEQLLFDSAKVIEMLQCPDFEIQKRAVKLSVWDKPFYNRQDVENLNRILELIDSSFPERGKRGTKKQLLSSKEKEIWVCECGKSNDIGENCQCGKDVYGFKSSEYKPSQASSYIRQKIHLISEFLG
jgi:hypothetical protein